MDQVHWGLFGITQEDEDRTGHRAPQSQLHAVTTRSTGTILAGLSLAIRAPDVSVQKELKKRQSWFCVRKQSSRTTGTAYWYVWKAPITLASDIPWATVNCQHWEVHTKTLELWPPLEKGLCEEWVSAEYPEPRVWVRPLLQRTGRRACVGKGLSCRLGSHGSFCPAMDFPHVL